MRRFNAISCEGSQRYVANRVRILRPRAEVRSPNVSRPVLCPSVVFGCWASFLDIRPRGKRRFELDQGNASEPKNDIAPTFAPGWPEIELSD